MNKELIDALIIGAGPCGLFQAFQLGLQGVHCHIVESKDAAGGQCNELYADKPIYDIPGIPHILAGDLASQLLTQLKPFDPTFHFNTTVTHIKQDNDQGFEVHTEHNTVIHARHIIICSGAGAFTPVKMRIEGIDAYENSQLFYGSVPPDLIKNKRVVVTGDTAAALEETIRVSAAASEVTFIHRKRRLPDRPDLVEEIHKLQTNGAIKVIHGKITEAITNGKTLTGLRVTDNNKEIQEAAADMLLARLGNSPKMQNYSDWGIDTVRHHVSVSTNAFESNISGIYSVGDINQYDGKRKLILCGFHEATLAAFDIAARLNPESPVHTQYTTTSTRLLQRLGVLKEPETQNL